MNIIPLLVKEFEEEAVTTRKMLALVPADKLGWKPHQKSMTMEQLTTHLADIPSWSAMMLATTQLDFAAGDYEPKHASSAEELLHMLDVSLDKTRKAFGNAQEDDLWPTWTLRNGDQVLAVMSKYEAIRHAFSQSTHHRAQLGVYLRLLDIPIPGSYGPSADEMNF